MRIQAIFLLAEELDRNLRRRLIHRSLNFFCSLGEPIGVDVDSDVTPWASHVFVGLEPPNCLLELMPALQTLKLDLVRINISHQGLTAPPSVAGRQNPIRIRHFTTIARRIDSN